MEAETWPDEEVPPSDAEPAALEGLPEPVDGDPGSARDEDPDPDDDDEDDEEGEEGDSGDA